MDYSWELYSHFQSLRSYRQTRFQIDPEGFDVKTEDREDYREEKIDLPPGWLRGFMQLQGAM
ncbi:MAG: metal-binding protein, partial [Phycisphaerae bacterium]